LLHDLPERSDARATFCTFRSGIHKHADMSDALGLLRARRERPSSSAA